MPLTSLFLDDDSRSVLHIGRGRANHARPVRETFHQTEVPISLSGRDRGRPNMIGLEREYDAVSVALHDGTPGHHQAVWAAFRTALGRLFQERHPHTHVGKYARILLVDADAHFHRGLAEIGG